MLLLSHFLHQTFDSLSFVHYLVELDLSGDMSGQHGEENKYKVGDYVYIEQSQSDPLVIRRIDELQKTAQGNVAAKVVSFYERIKIYRSLLNAFMIKYILGLRPR